MMRDIGTFGPRRLPLGRFGGGGIAGWAGKIDAREG